MAARDERAAFDLGLFWSKAGAEWGSLGLKCVLRHNDFGAPCGYVRVPAGHVLYGRNPCDEAMYDLDVHGGITFAEFVGDEFYLGFDMAHAFDIEYVWSDPHIKCIRTDQECIDETDHLAEQIAELGATGMWSKLKLWWMKRHRDRGVKNDQG